MSEVSRPERLAPAPAVRTRKYEESKQVSAYSLWSQTLPPNAISYSLDSGANTRSAIELGCHGVLSGKSFPFVEIFLGPVKNDRDGGGAAGPSKGFMDVLEWNPKSL